MSWIPSWLVKFKDLFTEAEKTYVKPVEVIKPALPVLVSTELTVIQKLLPVDQYINQDTTKQAICLHHTAGGDYSSTIAWWKQNKERVGTHFLIDRDGTIYQCVPTKKWAYHLFVPSPGNKIPKKYKALNDWYDKHTIAVEICNFGPLKVRNGRFYNIYNKSVDKDRVVQLNYKGYKYWEKYTNEQIESLEKLIIKLLALYPDIAKDLKDSYHNFCQIDYDVLDFNRGITTHVNYRTDKSDIFCQPELINMLNGLKSKINGV